jgi:hypothetical protein
MRGKALKIVTLILQGFKRLDVLILFIFSFIPQNCFDFGGASYTPENAVINNLLTCFWRFLRQAPTASTKTGLVSCYFETTLLSILRFPRHCGAYSQYAK